MIVNRGFDLLAEHRAQIEPGGRILSRNGFGETLLMTAAMEYGFIKKERWPPKRWLLDCIPKQLASEVNWVDECGHSVLLEAASHCNGPMVRLLLRHPKLRINEVSHNPCFPTKPRNVKQLIRYKFPTSNVPFTEAFTASERLKYDNFKGIQLEERDEEAGSLSAKELAFNKALIEELEAHPNFSQSEQHVGAVEKWKKLAGSRGALRKKPAAAVQPRSSKVKSARRSISKKRGPSKKVMKRPVTGKITKTSMKVAVGKATETGRSKK